MTIEEAIKVINSDLADCEKLTEARAIVTPALEKQIAKKPIIEKANIVCFYEFYCPSCKKRIISRIDGEWIAGRLQKHCDECGQSLNWDLEKEIEDD